MRKLKHFLISVLFLFIIWIALTGLNDNQELILGGIVSILVSLFLFRCNSIFAEFRINPKSIAYLFMYVFVFIAELIKSNIDVAFRVLHPNIPIKPGIVKVRTKLKSRIGRLFLANSITLTPGTLSVETDEDYFYIHWIDVGTDDIESTTKAIVGSFEKYLEVIFG